MVKDKDINEFNNLAQNFSLIERLNCLRITKCLDNLNNDEHENNLKLSQYNNDTLENNLKLSVYILQKGLLVPRESQIENLKKILI